MQSVCQHKFAPEFGTIYPIPVKTCTQGDHNLQNKPEAIRLQGQQVVKVIETLLAGD